MLHLQHAVLHTPTLRPQHYISVHHWWLHLLLVHPRGQGHMTCSEDLNEGLQNMKKIPDLFDLPFVLICFSTICWKIHRSAQYFPNNRGGSIQMPLDLLAQWAPVSASCWFPVSLPVTEQWAWGPWSPHFSGQWVGVRQALSHNEWSVYCCYLYFQLTSSHCQRMQ